MTPNEIIVMALWDSRWETGDDKRADAILAALEENGMAVGGGPAIELDDDTVVIRWEIDGEEASMTIAATDAVFYLTGSGEKAVRRPIGYLHEFLASAARPAGTVKEG